MMEEEQIVSNFKNIGTTLEASLITLDRTRTIVDFFEGCCLDEFELTSDEQKLFLKGIQKIRKSLDYVMNEIEDAENQVCSLCSKITSEDKLVYSLVIDSLDRMIKPDNKEKEVLSDDS